MRRLSPIVILWLALVVVTSAHAQPAPTNHVLLIGGLGGDANYTGQFARYLAETRTLLIDRHGVPEANVTVLAEAGIADRPFVDGESTAENIRDTFERIGRRIAAGDQLWVILFGHGSYDGSRASLNIPRRDLSDVDYGALLDGIAAERIVFINTASTSGPFAEALAGPDRVVITATARGTERDATVFPQYVVEALGSPDADLDKDGAVSARELFVYAAGRATRTFEDAGQIATEHAALEDDGDGKATRADALEGASDGHLAAATFLRPPQAISAADLPLVQERQELERQIAAVKQRKAQLSEDAYYVELETLFVRLARLNERLDP
ncbi:MAG TPA: hypothetical protein VF190_15175 [Rhodothermales bacterium]